MNNNDIEKDCFYYFTKYIEKKEIELKGCSSSYKMENVIFSTFNNLSIYFPEAYQHMLKIWKVKDE